MNRTEAIEIIKRNCTESSQLREACGVFIPELRESEDERIRKFLIAHVTDWIGCIEHDLKLSSKDVESEEELAMFKAGLTYLEKQKEQPKEELVYRLNGLMQDYIKEGKDEKEKEHRFKCYQLFWDALEDANFFEQKEQKPAEWSEDWREEDIQTRFAFYTYKDDPSVLYLSNVFVEETSRNHGFGTKILKAAEKAAESVGATTIRLKVKQNSPANAWYRKNGYGYMTFEDGYDWLEKTLEYMKPVKQEWSEEDEKLLDFWLDVIDRNDWRMDENFCKASREFINRLKSLRPQPKQEWSKKDERKIQQLVALLKSSKEKCMAAFYKDIDECIAWICGLRPQPHWKPSEEQMMALNYFIKLWGNSDDQLEYTQIFNTVKSLRDDLKKLI